MRKFFFRFVPFRFNTFARFISGFHASRNLSARTGKIIQDGLSSGFSIVFTANLHSVVMFNPLARFDIKDLKRCCVVVLR